MIDPEKLCEECGELGTVFIERPSEPTDRLLCEKHAAERVKCDGKRECAQPVTMLDDKGYAYCTEHGMSRRSCRPCRKLRPEELRKLWRGEALKHY